MSVAGGCKFMFFLISPASISEVVIKLIESTIKGSAIVLHENISKQLLTASNGRCSCARRDRLISLWQLNLFFHRFRFRFHNLRFHRFRAEPEPEPASCQNTKYNVFSRSSRHENTKPTMNNKTCCKLYIHKIREHKISKAQKNQRAQGVFKMFETNFLPIHGNLLSKF